VKGQRKDDVMHDYLARSDGSEGVLFIGRAQEKARIFRTEKRRNPTTGAAYPWIVTATAMVNHFYPHRRPPSPGSDRRHLVATRDDRATDPGL
jgi:hypothetical protein